MVDIICIFVLATMSFLHHKDLIDSSSALIQVKGFVQRKPLCEPILTYQQLDPMEETFSGKF